MNIKKGVVSAKAATEAAARFHNYTLFVNDGRACINGLGHKHANIHAPVKRGNSGFGRSEREREREGCAQKERWTQ